MILPFSATQSHTSKLYLMSSKEEFSKLGLQFSWEKAKLMHDDDGPDPPTTTMGIVPVEFMSSFNYLGSTVTNAGDLNEEISCHQSLAAAMMQSLSRPLLRHICITQCTKLGVYNVSVVPILLYGSETWLLSESLTKKIDGFDL